MKKYIIPAIMVVEAKEPFMLGKNSVEGNGQMLGNDSFFDDMDDDLDNNTKTKRLWDDNEARYELSYILK